MFIGLFHAKDEVIFRPGVQHQNLHSSGTCATRDNHLHVLRRPKVGTKPSSAARTAQPPPVAAVSAAAATVDIAVPTEPAEKESTWALVKTLCANPGFQVSSAGEDTKSVCLVCHSA